MSPASVTPPDDPAAPDELLPPEEPVPLDEPVGPDELPPPEEPVLPDDPVGPEELLPLEEPVPPDDPVGPEELPPPELLEPCAPEEVTPDELAPPDDPAGPEELPPPGAGGLLASAVVDCPSTVGDDPHEKPQTDANISAHHSRCGVALLVRIVQCTGFDPDCEILQGTWFTPK